MEENVMLIVCSEYNLVKLETNCTVILPPMYECFCHNRTYEITKVGRYES